MSDDMEVTLATSEVQGRGDVKRIEVKQTYIPPLDGTRDALKGFDTHVARTVAECLVENYPGYEWYVMAETRQGIVAFSIPALMGPTLKQVIRLAEFTDLRPSLVRDLGGQLLERMGLRRGPRDEAEYQLAFLRRHTFDFSDVKS